MQIGDKLFGTIEVDSNVAYVHMPIKSLIENNNSQEEFVYNILTDGNHTYHANGLVVHSVQPSFDADYVKNGLKELKQEEAAYLFKSVAETEDPERLLQVLGKAWGVSVPQAFKETMERMHG